ncbi:MAG: serine hydrolase [Patescibacteria group bacterium]
MIRTRHFFYAALCLSAVVGVGAVLGFLNREKVAVNIAQETFFKEPALVAKSAVVYDLRDGKIIFSKEADAQLPLASLTKIMTALAAVSAIPEGTSIQISESDLRPEGDSGLQAGSLYKRDTLLSFALTASSNDAAEALGVAAVAYAGNLPSVGDLLKSGAEESGLTGSYFLNPTGLDISSSTAGAYGSATDIAKLLGELSSKAPHVLESTTRDKIEIPGDTKKRTLSNTNPNAARTPGLLASKTGYTDLAGGNLAIIFDAGLQHPVAIVVLGSTEEDRFTDVEKLISETRKAIAGDIK